MLKALLPLVLAVELGAGFGPASAELVSTSSNAVEVELRVETTVSADTVVAHLASEGRPHLTLPMVHEGEGVFSIRVELEPVNYRVVFEILGPDPAQSSSYSLMELGLSFGGSPTSTTTAAVPVPDPGDITQWLWLAVAFGAAALSALAFWALGGDDQTPSVDDDPGDSPSEGGSTAAGDDGFLA